MRLCSARAVSRPRKASTTPQRPPSIATSFMKSTTSCNCLFPSRRVRRAIAGLVGRAAPDPGGVHDALRRAERPAPCGPAGHRPFSVWSARLGPLGWSARHALRGPEGSVWPAISSDTAARWQSISTVQKYTSNHWLRLPSLLVTTTIQRTGVLNIAPFWGSGSASPPGLRSSLEPANPVGTMTILPKRFWGHPVPQFHPASALCSILSQHSVLAFRVLHYGPPACRSPPEETFLFAVRSTFLEKPQ